MYIITTIIDSDITLRNIYRLYITNRDRKFTLYLACCNIIRVFIFELKYGVKSVYKLENQKKKNLFFMYIVSPATEQETKITKWFLETISSIGVQYVLHKYP